MRTKGPSVLCVAPGKAHHVHAFQVWQSVLRPLVEAQAPQSVPKRLGAGGAAGRLIGGCGVWTSKEGYVFGQAMAGRVEEKQLSSCRKYYEQRHGDRKWQTVRTVAWWRGGCQRWCGWTQAKIRAWRETWATLWSPERSFGDPLRLLRRERSGPGWAVGAFLSSADKMWRTREGILLRIWSHFKTKNGELKVIRGTGSLSFILIFSIENVSLFVSLFVF